MINKINIKWLEYLIYAFYFTYGFYGGLTLHAENLSSKPLVYLTIQLSIPAILFMYLKNSFNKFLEFKENYTITANDLVVFLGILLFIFFINFDSFKYSLYGDELSYLGSAFAREIEFLKILSNKTSLLNNLTANVVIQILAFIFLSLHIILFYLIRGVNLKKKIAILLFITILLRLAYIFLTPGNSNPHPPLQFIPLSILGVFIGIKSYAFKFCYTFSFSLLVFYLYRIFSNEIPKLLSLLMVAAIATIPLLLILSATVEPSIWTFICFTLVLFETKKKKINYIKLSYLIAIFSLLRQPCIFAFVYILALYIKEKKYKINLIEFTKVFHPIAVYLPYLISSIFYGTPSTEVHFGIKTTLLNLINIKDFVQNAIGVIWPIFLPLAFLKINLKKIKIVLPILFFFLVLIFIYYSIRSDLWGRAKYQAEYILPFVIFGFYKLIRYLTIKQKFKSIHLLLFCLILLNFVTIKSQKFHLNFNKKEEVFYHKYKYEDAYKFIKDNNLEKCTYSIGSTYGIFPEILNNYKVYELKFTDLIYKKQKISGGEYDTYNSINANQMICAVLAPKLEIYNSLIQELIENNWAKIYESGNEKENVPIIVLRKN